MAKKSKIKTKKVSTRPRLVVVNPWSPDPEVIAGWFSIMLKDDYPDAQVNVIYHRKNNGSKIVELSSDVKDISMCLGTHYFGSFLKTQRGSPAFSVIYEYRMSYASDPAENNWTEAYVSNKPPPPNFPVVYPYPPPLPVKPISEFYVDQEYACTPSPTNLERMEKRRQEKIQKESDSLVAKSNTTADPRRRVGSLVASSSSSSGPTSVGAATVSEPRISSIPRPGQSSSSAVLRTNATSTATSSIPPKDLPEPLRVPDTTKSTTSTSTHQHLNRPAEEKVVVKKMDPYEEAEVAEELLRSVSPVKKSRFEAEDFLNSLSTTFENEEEEEERKPDLSDLDRYTTVKEEKPDIFDLGQSHVREPVEDDYKPSMELLDLFSTLGPDHENVPVPPRIKTEDAELVIIKPEPIDNEIPNGNLDDDDYKPSAELMAMFSGIEPEMAEEQETYSENDTEDRSYSESSRLSMRQATVKRNYEPYREREESPYKRIKTEDQETGLFS